MLLQFQFTSLRILSQMDRTDGQTYRSTYRGGAHLIMCQYGPFNLNYNISVLTLVSNVWVWKGMLHILLTGAKKINVDHSPTGVWYTSISYEFFLLFFSNHNSWALVETKVMFGKVVLIFTLVIW